MNSFEYYINEKERAPAGQVYLGSFLAVVLFISFFFGSLLFFLIVLIISVFVFLDGNEKLGDEWGRIKVVFSSDYFTYGNKKYNYTQLSRFAVSRELFGEEAINLRFSFRARGSMDMFLPVPTESHLKKIYDIIAPSVTEDKKTKLSLAEQIFIRFF